MKPIAIAISATIALLPLPALAQTTPSAPLAKGTGLPPLATEEAQVLAALDRLFAIYARGDGPALLTAAFPDGQVTSVDDGKMGQLSFTRLSQMLTPETAFTVRIGHPAIEIDADIAMVWVPYADRTNGKITNCGTAHFDLVRHHGTWKVLNSTFTARTTGCEGP